MDRMKIVTVVVLGDIGRSPRMQYHSLSLSNEGFFVKLVGYTGPKHSSLLPDLVSSSHVQAFPLKECPEFKNYLPGFCAYIAKVVWQFITLLWALFLSGTTDVILVQNPPGIPTLPACFLYTLIKRAQFFIDWHNYTHSMLALNVGQNSVLVKISSAIEFWMGRFSDGALCVTKAMQEDLALRGVKATVFYDRPPSIFRPVTLQERHELLLKISNDYPDIIANCSNNETIFTCLSKEGVTLKSHRPGFIVSSTSWTEDEDFSILFNALQMYENSINSGEVLPNLLCAVTGKGPLKEFYRAEIQKQQWKHVAVITPWLSPEDYPKFLGCADLGVSLHKSSSGLDLPMKVVDMFGVELPVCAINFNCIHELVKNGVTGYIFDTSSELSQYFKDWFNCDTIPYNRDSIRKNLHQFQKLRWHENWLNIVLPMIKK